MTEGLENEIHSKKTHRRPNKLKIGWWVDMRTHKNQNCLEHKTYSTYWKRAVILYIHKNGRYNLILF